MKRPNDDDLLCAADWLDYNDGEESAKCKRVADWLRATVEGNALRAMSRQAGIPVSLVRKRLAQKDGAKNS